MFTQLKSTYEMFDFFADIKWKIKSYVETFLRTTGCGNFVFVLFKILVSLANVVGPKQEEHPVQQFCQYRLQTREEGGCWSPVTTRLLLSQDNRTAARTESLSSQNDQVGEQEEVWVLSE